MRTLLFVFLAMLLSATYTFAVVGPHWATGKITSLMASGTDPAIRLEGNISPTGCDVGTYGWIYFQGTPEERTRIYATALALSLTGKIASSYTNSDGTLCRIHTIQITSGLN